MRTIAWAVVTAATVVGCGGGGGGAPAPAPATGIAEGYYPVATGARWIWTLGSGDSAQLDVSTITGTRSVGGAQAWVFSDSDPAGVFAPVESYYSKDSRAYTYRGTNVVADWVSAAIAPLELMRFDGRFSASPLFDQAGLDIGVDLDGDGVSERADVKVNGTVESTDTLVTDLGSFSGTARLRYDIVGTVRLSTGGAVPFTQTLREWRAPGVGALRQTVATSVAGQTDTQALELTGFSVNGVSGGAVLLGEVLSHVAPPNSDTTQPGAPGLASDGSAFLLVGNRAVGTLQQPWATLLDSAGQAHASVPLGDPASLWDSPAVAWGGANYLVLSGGSNGAPLRAQRVSASGALVDALPGIPLAADGSGFARALAGGAGGWLVVYTRVGIAHTLFGRTVDGSGGVGPEITLATDFADMDPPAVGFDGSNFLVAWEAGAGSVDPAATDIHARRVTPAGGLPDMVPLVVSAAPEAQLWPRVACDPARCLVAWVDRRNAPGQSYGFSPGPGDLYGSFVDPTGAVVNPSGLALATGITANAGYPGLAFTGSEYLLAWSRGAYAGNPGGPTGIYAARVALDGSASTAAVPAGLALSGTPASSTRYVYPAVAAGATGAMVAWLSNSEMTGMDKALRATTVWPRLAR
ncbi:MULTISPECIES: hypothetical protein [Ramlibacter]|uniref:Lipoprotein n=1 Tax=Ramlibacter aquaticus TaxID=2780094 RepID=A0ABR9SC59_9BURK|nr:MULTISPECIES: hypothetical protein [Ramlibacter]MBE7939890.1 hypothetical protein [Ramlibacter aquaticus]